MSANRRFVLTPNRSFSAISTTILFVLLAGWVAGLAVFSWTHQTWPILAFAGGELLGLALAFAVHFHRSRAYEEVILTPELVQWTRYLPSGATQRWQAPLTWVKIGTEAPQNTRGPLTLKYAGQILQFGAFLGPEERGSFAARFRTAQRDILSKNREDVD